ncbi:uncharacterized protein LOC122821041 [Gambusia affinis]|uniref:uncharacterized protein LOC122821041 n=1 Tax=Gambusia affinis TaxID=33528 RepID=UPI001CDD52CC|nr:uncharacterized protein LOC122821041 [Gambusia affinis]
MPPKLNHRAAIMAAMLRKALSFDWSTRVCRPVAGRFRVQRTERQQMETTSRANYEEEIQNHQQVSLLQQQRNRHNDVEQPDSSCRKVSDRGSARGFEPEVNDRMDHRDEQLHAGQHVELDFHTKRGKEDRDDLKYYPGDVSVLADTYVDTPQDLNHLHGNHVVREDVRLTGRNLRPPPAAQSDHGDEERQKKSEADGKVPAGLRLSLRFLQLGSFPSRCRNRSGRTKLLGSDISSAHCAEKQSAFPSLTTDLLTASQTDKPPKLCSSTARMSRMV